MTKDEALRLALEALELHGKQYPHMVKGYCIDAITAIKEALAQPWEKFCDSNCVWTDHHPNCKLEQPEHGWTPKRIAGMARLKEAQDKKLSQHKWIGLKDEDKSLFSSWLDHKTDDEVFTAIEAKLKEKNT